MVSNDILIPAATVVSSVLLFAGVVVTALVRRRKPTEVTDYMAENRSLRDDLTELRKDFDTYRTNKDKEFSDYKVEMDGKLEERDRERRAFRHFVSVISEALDAAWSYVKVLQATMNDAGITAPEPSAYVKMATDAARDVRAANSLMEEV